MILALVEGLAIGLATTVLVGPVFFTLLRASLDHGQRGGFAVALGIIASDIMVVAICSAGLSASVQRTFSGPWMALAAGVLLLVLGVSYLLKRPTNPYGREPLGRRGMLGLFTSGFAVNFVNPFVFAIWIGVSMRATSGYGHQGWGLLGGALAGILISDLAKAHFAPRLRSLLTLSTLRKLYLLIGIALLVFSIRMFLHASNGGM
ncbi:MAG: LysE family transporter [Flavobacteriales bacterium]|jgi:threonine/homoserine/homoserine lactone efflux protein|nr:LysE family transporter [Flavobacteriales bacterium]MBK6550262.1 LysE family transporter [Flavobacteriales bacterium]MBK6881574.1 LysE family transporter [Flavobacteriales bacterium]MBK7102891.1 LysE family transporter [Flavobacteriales bacterium]MBK7113505.1 LysE family transporter [Flavobacteriales bacterium]